MRRVANLSLSSSEEEGVEQYSQALWEYEDLTDASRRNYLSDLRHFAAWYEAYSVPRTDEISSSQTGFDPRAITTPALTRYRVYLQKALRQKLNSINRALISIKRDCGWAMQKQLISYDPSVPVKLVSEEEHAPCHLEDEAEQALMPAVTNEGTLRDRVLIVLRWHTGLRAREICQLRRDQVKLGKRNKHREVPLDAATRKALEEYLATLPSKGIFLFHSGKTKADFSECVLGNIINKYIVKAKLFDADPQDLRHRFGYRLAESIPLHRHAQIMGHDSLDTTRLYIQETRHDLQQAVETIAWI